MTDPVARNLHRQAEAAKSLMRELADHDDDTRHDTVEGETDFYEAIDAALAEMDQCDVIVAGCAEVIAKYTDRKKKYEARKDRIRTLIEQAMLLADTKTVKRPLATFSVRDVPPSPMVSDEALIPSKYWEPQPNKLNKAALNRDAKAGEDIPGVTMTNGGTSLQIRKV